MLGSGAALVLVEFCIGTRGGMLQEKSGGGVLVGWRSFCR